LNETNIYVYSQAVAKDSRTRSALGVGGGSAGSATNDTETDGGADVLATEKADGAKDKDEDADDEAEAPSVSKEKPKKGRKKGSKGKSPKNSGIYILIPNPPWYDTFPFIHFLKVAYCFKFSSDPASSNSIKTIELCRDSGSIPCARDEEEFRALAYKLVMPFFAFYINLFHLIRCCL